jgi:hypothetical protein
MSRILCSAAVVSGQACVVRALRSALALLAAALLSPAWALAAVVPLMPEQIVIEDMDNHGDPVFILYLEGQFDRGVLLDPKAAERLSGAVRLPPGPPEGALDNEGMERARAAQAKGFPGLPVGRLSLLGVPRGLVGEGRVSPDPAWREGRAPLVVRVTGVIHHYPVEKSRALHQYKLEKADDGLKMTLLNPDVLTPYPPENLGSTKESQPAYLWLGLAGAVLIGAVLVVWILMRRGSQSSSGIVTR